MTVAENHLIAQLPQRSRMPLPALCESVQVEIGTVLCDPGAPARHVYFPIDSFISLVTA